MTPMRWGNPHRNADARFGKLVLSGLGFLAIAIVATMIGFIMHEWRLPAEASTPQSQLQRAEKALQSGNNQAALATFAKLSEEDNPFAQYWLGHMTELGLGVPHDLKKAIDLYKKAAAQGVPAAESRLGEAYLRGDVALPDFAQARTYLEEAARRGDARAAMLLGRMYRTGLGVTADAKEAYAWSEVATIEGSPFATHERDASLSGLSTADQKAAVARAQEILDQIRRETANAKPQ